MPPHRSGRRRAGRRGRPAFPSQSGEPTHGTRFRRPAPARWHAHPHARRRGLRGSRTLVSEVAARGGGWPRDGGRLHAGPYLCRQAWLSMHQRCCDRRHGSGRLSWHPHSGRLDARQAPAGREGARRGPRVFCARQTGGRHLPWGLDSDFCRRLPGRAGHGQPRHQRRPHERRRDLGGRSGRGRQALRLQPQAGRPARLHGGGRRGFGGGGGGGESPSWLVHPPLPPTPRGA